MATDPTTKALMVMVLDPKIRAFLLEHDPQALKQAMNALRGNEGEFIASGALAKIEEQVNARLAQPKKEKKG